MSNKEDFDLNSLLARGNEKTKKVLEKKEEEESFFEDNKKEVNPVVKQSIEELTKNVKAKANKRTFGYYINVELDKKLEDLATKLKTNKSEVLESILSKIL